MEFFAENDIRTRQPLRNLLNLSKNKFIEAKWIDLDMTILWHEKMTNAINVCIRKDISRHLVYFYELNHEDISDCKIGTNK